MRERTLSADLNGRVAIVTGAGRGIGRGIAVMLAQCGADVAVVDLNGENAESVAEEVRSLGRHAIARAVDVSRQPDLNEVVQSIANKLGRLDIAVNNAGIVEVRRFLDVTEDHWDRVFAVNTKGTLFGIQAAARLMIEFGIEGRIVNIASVAGKGGRPLLAAYAASKAAIINLTQSAAYSLAEYKITVNCICPGVVGTDMGRKALSEMEAITGAGGVSGEQSRVPSAPLGPEATPQDVAGMVMYLVSSSASYITAQAMNVDGGRCTH